MQDIVAVSNTALAQRTVAAHQIVSVTACRYTATDLFCVPPYHLRVMTGRIPILLCQYSAVPISLFVDPALDHRPQRIPRTYSLSIVEWKIWFTLVFPTDLQTVGNSLDLFSVMR